MLCYVQYESVYYCNPDNTGVICYGCSANVTYTPPDLIVMYIYCTCSSICKVNITAQQFKTTCYCTNAEQGNDKHTLRICGIKSQEINKDLFDTKNNSWYIQNINTYLAEIYKKEMILNL